jgi:LmbE family N-acetylglucosaminyl deacetylase
MKSVLAIFAHPDDIEFVAAGTLLLLRNAGWDIHYCNLANGCCGSTQTDRQQTEAIRLIESQNAARLLNAKYYPPICDDLDVFYNRENLAKVAAIVRAAQPSIVLTHAPVDYMEDHTETCRLAVTAAFTKGIPNFVTQPAMATYDGDVAIYHAQPHGNRTPLNEAVAPDFVIAIDSVMQEKLAMLQCHVSQQAWLQASQKMNSYLQTMLDQGVEVAKIANASCQYAEGWRRHLHLGFSKSDHAPLETALSEVLSRLSPSAMLNRESRA